MENFIDQELNSCDENEAILLDIDDLMDFKKSHPKRKGRKHNKNGGQNRIKEKEKSTEIYNYPNFPIRNDKSLQSDTQNLSDDANELLIKRGERKKSHGQYWDEQEEEEGEGGKDGEEEQEERPIDGLKRWRNKCEPDQSYYRFFPHIYGRLKSYYNNDIINSFRNKFNRKTRRDDDFFSHENYLSFDFLHILASRLYYSRGTMRMYFFVTVLNLFTLIYSLSIKIVNIFVVTSEIFIILMLFMEIFLRLVTQGRRYFYNFEGLFDVIVTIMCFLLLLSSGDLKVFFKSDMAKMKNTEMEEIVSQSLTVFRFSFHLFRTITLFMHYERVKAPTDKIDFSVLNLSHDEEVKEDEEEDYIV
ncbi:hypothetical protein, conserved [Plasmodium gonderi]|uniref:Ion transport domain-containing protein n=1 Tax=Plasmodium gonderi TaxID=77519 RepID=A0A1Y1JNB0_PLAGO|nr:hypothetical protein, conserved [Plasmodium gonderi]GAW82935.1 hypothetical protein, conserved [Plasmodium gonderi]